MSSEDGAKLSAARNPRFSAARLIIAGIAFVLGGVVVWAGIEVLRVDDAALAELPYATATVTAGEVSQTLSLNAVATWPAAGSLANRAAGTVTSVDVEAGEELASGSRLYAVDQRPTIVAQGTTPMFRQLRQGDTGTDVAQLQGMLATVAPGTTGGDDGVFDAATAASVRAWQRSQGVSDDGEVRLGDIVFVPELPTRLRLDTETIYPGALLSGGERAISGLGQPAFTIALDDLQTRLVPDGAQVSVQGPDGAWDSTVQGISHESTGTVATLGTADGAPVCGSECAQAVNTAGEAIFPVTIVIVPPTKGLTVPSAAIATEANGDTVVIGKTGERHPVSVIAAAQGMTVVEGVEAGLSVRVPADAPGRNP